MQQLPLYSHPRRHSSRRHFLSPFSSTWRALSLASVWFGLTHLDGDIIGNMDLCVYFVIWHWKERSRCPVCSGYAPWVFTLSSLSLLCYFLVAFIPQNRWPLYCGFEKSCICPLFKSISTPILVILVAIMNYTTPLCMVATKAPAGCHFCRVCNHKQLAEWQCLAAGTGFDFLVFEKFSSHIFNYSL